MVLLLTSKNRFIGCVPEIKVHAPGKRRTNDFSIHYLALTLGGRVTLREYKTYALHTL